MNAADNPFSTGRLERLLAFDPELAGTTWEAIERRWMGLGRPACVTGPRGSGKTTFLDALALRQELPVCRLFFNCERNRLSASDRVRLEGCAGSVLLVDGDEHLPRTERKVLLAAAERAGRSLFARHRRQGLPELMRLRSSEELAMVLLERISPEWRTRLGSELGHRLRKSGGNLRELWLDLYDLAASTRDV